MEKREPSLVPEWLRSTPSSGGSGSNNRNSSRSSRSDASPFLDRSYSTNTTRSNRGPSSNGYNSFNVNRNSRGDRDWRREKDTRLNTYLDPWDDTIPIRDHNDQLRRSYSMTTRRQGNNSNGTNSSPIASVVNKSLSSALISSGEGWTSALAEVPSTVVVKSTVGSSANVTVPRNMAEALVKAPQVKAVATMKPEDREIMQLRQLIPVLPSTTKVNNSNKMRAVVRSGGDNGLSSLRNIQTRNLHQSTTGSGSDTSVKKLVVLKPARENGLSGGGGGSGSGDSPPNDTHEDVATSPPPTTVEKKVSLAQRSRNAFFNALKEKPSTKEIVSACDSGVKAEEVSQVVEEKNNGGGFEDGDYPDEEEAEFLKSLGWDENITEEDQALTEEEIKEFIEQVKKLKPALIEKMRIVQ